MLNHKKTLIAGFLILCACLGLGRFGFGMVIPNMQESLALTSTQIGSISSFNFTGYILGILFINRIYSHFATHKLIFVSLILQGSFMLLMSFSSTAFILSLLYFFCGFFMALVNMSLMAYMSDVIPKNIRGKALGIAVSGSGLAIVFSGLIVPIIENKVIEMPWKTTWMFFSILVIIVAFISQLVLKKHNKHELKSNKTNVFVYFKDTTFLKIASLYMIFGFTYIIYVTFFVNSIILKHDLTTSISGEVWALLGFSSIFSGFIFGFIADKFGAYKSLFLVFFLQSCSHLILALPLDAYFIWISAFLFGITVWSVPALAALLISISFDVKKMAQVLALATLIFSFAQALGPFIAGIMKDYTGSFDLIFYFSAFLCFVAMISAYVFEKQSKLLNKK